MDHFGIGAGVKGATNAYFQPARRTGRTTSLVDSLKDGDRVIFTNAREAGRVKRLCADRGVDIEIVVTPPASPEGLFGRGPCRNDGRAIFDHSWVEEYYRLAIERAAREIDQMQRGMSGRAESRRETERAAFEAAKWAQF